jgi:hypothetical protein
MVEFIIFGISIAHYLKSLAFHCIISTCKIYFAQVCQVMLSDQPNGLDLKTVGMGSIPTALTGKIFMIHRTIIYVQM